MEVSTVTLIPTCPNSLGTQTTHKEKVYPKDLLFLLLFVCWGSFKALTFDAGRHNMPYHNIYYAPHHILSN